MFWAISPSILASANVRPIAGSTLTAQTWVSGNFAETIIDGPGWRWGYGMCVRPRASSLTFSFTIVVPVLITPVIAILAVVQRRARRSGALQGVIAPWKASRASVVARDLFWTIDVIGLVCADSRSLRADRVGAADGRLHASPRSYYHLCASCASSELC